MKLVPTYHWIIRGLIAAALAAPLALLALDNPYPPLETDLQRVFARLPKQSEFERLDSWCGLEVSDVKPAEAAWLRAISKLPPTPISFVRFPLIARAIKLRSTSCRTLSDGIV